MAFVGVHFTDGPCAGKYTLLDFQGSPPATTRCGGKIYYLSYTGPENADGSLTKPAAPVGVTAGSSMSAWNQLRHTINVTLPGELHLASKYLRESLHELRNIRVRG